MRTTNVLRVRDLDRTAVQKVLDLAEAGHLEPVLAGKGVALVFEHPSARTRSASEMAVVQLGGHPVSIRAEEIGLDTRESVEDVARTLACYHRIVAARVARHETLVRMAEALSGDGIDVGVVNLLSDEEHPTQALADLLTIRQCFPGIEGRTLAYIGDANNVCRSLVDVCSLAGIAVKVAAPEGHRLSAEAIEGARRLGGSVTEVETPEEAAEGADILYSDVWVSMGDDADADAKRASFAGYTIDDALLARALPGAILLHCLPAHRGEEVTAGVIDGPQSRVWAQAGNRMHAIRGLFAYILGAEVTER